MSFILTATCVKTTDMEGVDLAYGDGSSLTHRVLPTQSPYIMVWSRRWSPDPKNHHVAADASKRWGEAFYVGTDSVVSSLGYARYVQGELARSVFYMDNGPQETTFETKGSPDPWEAAVRVRPTDQPFPSSWSPGVRLPYGDHLCGAILAHYGCPEGPAPERFPELGPDELAAVFCDLRRPSYERRRCLDAMAARCPDLPAALRSQGRIASRPLPGTGDEWDRMHEDFRIVRAMSLDIGELKRVLAAADEDDERYAGAAEAADIISAYDKALAPELASLRGG